MGGSTASRTYRALLRILPLHFRVAHAADMEELFMEALRGHGVRGRIPWLAAWVRGTADVVWLAVRLRLGSFPARGHRRGREGLWGSLLEDLRFSVRTLRRRPLFATVAILTLGLGIGASTAMFSVVNGVLLEKLPYDQPDRLVAVWQTVPFQRGAPGDDGARWDRTRLTYAQYRDLSEVSTLYDGLAAYRAGTPDVATLTGVGNPVELRAGAASASLLSVLGVRLARGRWFLPGEEASRAGDDGASVAVISYELWQGRFGGSPGTLGRSVTLDDRPYTIVGILPPGFRVTWVSASVAGEGTPGRRDIWFPIGAPGWRAAEQGYSWEVIGRLGPGVTVAQAQNETQIFISAHQDSFGDARVLPRAAEETRGLGPPLLLLLGATALLLLIACGNIATLAAAEIQGRRHELATRAALGARSSRIVRLLLTESIVLALLGSVLGVVLAFGGTEVLVSIAPPIPHLDEVGVDVRVLVFAIALGVCTAFFFGAGPSILASRGATGPVLTDPARTSTGRRRFSGVVVGTEIALTAVLLVAGGLLTRSLSRLLAVDPGFDPRGLATVELRLPRSRYPTMVSRAAFFRAALDKLEAVPGIGRVSGVSRLPFPGNTSGMSLRVGGQGEYLATLFYQVAPGYLETLGVPRLAGRFLSEADGPGAPPVIVVNEAAARRFWPHKSPVGAQVSLSHPRGPVTVVGVAGDMKRQRLVGSEEPAFFIPFSQLPDPDVCFVARTLVDPREALPLMRRAVTSVDPDLVVKEATTMTALIEASASHERYRSLLMSIFGILATLLAAAGVIGVTARSVSLRTREMGIRMALGARGSGLIRATVSDGLRVGFAGTAVGLVGAFWTSRLLTPFLYGIEASDLPTYAVVVLLLITLSVSASYVPARRISRVSPVDVLKA